MKGDAQIRVALYNAAHHYGTESLGRLGRELEKVLTVVHQLINGLLHISQSRVPLLLFECVVNLGPPALRQLLERADIQISIMEKCLQLWHVLGEKSPVLANAVATHRTCLFGKVPAQEVQDDFLRCLLRQAGSFYFVDQSTFSVGAPIPGIHAGKLFVTLMNHKHWPLNAWLEPGPCNDDSDFNDPVMFRIEASHLTIQPNKILV